MYVFKTLRQWADLVYNPLTGAMGIKSTYANSAYMLVNIFNKEGDVFRQLKFYNLFPTSNITPIPLDYSNSTTAYKISVELRSDYFDDIFN
jgi:hypothetical protein